MRAEQVRPIHSGDWNGIATLEEGAYAGIGLSEGRDALESRARSSPATSFVLDTGDRIGGYLLALPYPPFRSPVLDRAEETVFRSSNLHLHDIVVADELRGRGWAKRMLRQLTDTARSLRYERVSLVAVGGTADFWAARDYRVHPEIVLPAGYGPDAVYMSRAITGGR
ncbi:GNAT family N-acetyltransferase [Streptomyces sp. NBC_00338]|nr:GNAT family N-acetyltransferase [Streptomyces sp. NBC_00338]MCX5141824.1 GNAT family N-acetyltransferase [Streptomyces sp. NBC_00338]